MLAARLIVVWVCTLPVRLVTAFVLALRLAGWLLLSRPPGWPAAVCAGARACCQIVVVGGQWLDRYARGGNTAPGDNRPE
jgi:hypothetical protein